MNTEEFQTATELAEVNSPASHIDVSIICPNSRIVKVASISLNETTIFLKQALSENIDTSHYTNYTFEYRGDKDDEVIRFNDSIELVNYLSDVDSYREPGVKIPLALHISFDGYDERTAKQHTKKFKELIESSPSLRRHISEQKATGKLQCSCYNY